MDSSQIQKLQSLAQLDVDAIGAYEAAIKGARHEEVRAKLSEFRVDHARHVQDLNALILKYGGQAVEMKPDFKGAVLKTMTQFSGALGTEASLLAMVANEEITNRSYDAALKSDWDAEARAVLERNRDDERRHLAWIKQAIRERPWTREVEAHP